MRVKVYCSIGRISVVLDIPYAVSTDQLDNCRVVLHLPLSMKEGPTDAIARIKTQGADTSDSVDLSRVSCP